MRKSAILTLAPFLAAIVLSVGCQQTAGARHSGRETPASATVHRPALEDEGYPIMEQEVPTIYPVAAQPDERRDVWDDTENPNQWFARAGLGAWLPEIGEGWEPAPTFSVGRRMDDRWFIEAQATVPRWSGDYMQPGFKVDDHGRIWFYTLNFGREYDFFDSEDIRFRSHVGAGYFVSNSTGDNDSGFTTTLGAALQYNVWDEAWVHLGLAHYGNISDILRDGSSYRHNLLVDLSVVFDF